MSTPGVTLLDSCREQWKEGLEMFAMTDSRCVYLNSHKEMALVWLGLARGNSVYMI
jgi:hypothetical protein